MGGSKRAQRSVPLKAPTCSWTAQGLRQHRVSARETLGKGQRQVQPTVAWLPHARGAGAQLQAVLCLTALSDARLQKACLFLHPLKYVISGAYEALQEKK